MTAVSEVISYLESIAPPVLQESYDNSGLICGNRHTEVTGVIVSLDTIEAVVDEAIEMGCNLVVGHHPIIFSGLKSLTGRNYIERTLLKAIKNDIAIYAIHTNLDNVLSHGVNEQLAIRLGLRDFSILSPDNSILHFRIEVSDLLRPDVEQAIRSALESVPESFHWSVDEHRPLSINLPAHLRYIVDGVCTDYQVTYMVSEMHYSGSSGIGAGLLAYTPLPMPEADFLSLLKDRLELKVIRHTALQGRSIHKVALCGGSGSFLLPKAIRAGADAFVTADFKYHQFFDADGQLVIADVGHFESEQFTIDLLRDLISEKFSNFAARCAKSGTNPVSYYI